MDRSYVNQVVGPKRQGLLVADDLATFDNGEDRQKSEKIFSSRAISPADFQAVTREYADLKPRIDDVQSFHFNDIDRVLKTTKGNSFFQAISCGRSGTMWAYKFFVQLEGQYNSPFLPYHHLPIPLSSTLISEMFFRGVTSCFEKQVDEHNRAKTRQFFAGLYFRARLTELLHASIAQVVLLNHWETPFAPILASYYPNSKYFYLKRNRVDVIFSLLSSTVDVDSAGKQDCADFMNTITSVLPARRAGSILPGSQIRPFDVFRDGTGRAVFEPVAMTHLDFAAWQYGFARDMARSIEKFVGNDRFLNIDVDRLFQGDTDSKRDFVDYFGLDRHDADLLSRRVNRRFNAKLKTVSDGFVAEVKSEIERLLA